MIPAGYILTGQLTCYDLSGQKITYQDSGQDAEISKRVPWPYLEKICGNSRGF
jgi:hypothetical protein